MSFHIVMGKDADLPTVAREAAAGRAPSYVVSDLAAALGATIHSPLAVHDQSPSFTDKIRSKLIGRPDHWMLARHLVKTMHPGDVVWCTGEDVGIPMATLGRQRGIKTVLAIHNLDRPRGKLGMRLFNVTRSVDGWIVNAGAHRTFLRAMGVAEERIHTVLDRVDLKFFSPGPTASEKPRPVIASVGLEQRDYVTLAAATEALPVDVKISGFSRDAAALAKAFPTTMPANMSRKFYEWPELVDLYRSADVVVCSVFDNAYAAGVTTILEAASVGRPLVVTATRGLNDYLSAERAMLVPPSNPRAMRSAIEGLLADRAWADQLAQAARQHVERHHSNEQWVNGIAAVMRRLSESASDAPGR
jgi:glycosyltransferase involved in cell wall biosynthesis